MPKASVTLLGSTILDTGKTPDEWVAVFAERGLEVSERTLREKANRLGACYKLGREMIITPEQLDAIFMEGQPCRSKPIAGAIPIGSEAGLSSTGPRSPNTTGAALEQLRKLAHGPGAKPKRTGKSVVTSLAKRRC